MLNVLMSKSRTVFSAKSVQFEDISYQYVLPDFLSVRNCNVFFLGMFLAFIKWDAWPTHVQRRFTDVLSDAPAAKRKALGSPLKRGTLRLESPLERLLEDVFFYARFIQTNSSHTIPSGPTMHPCHFFMPCPSVDSHCTFSFHETQGKRNT